MQKVTVLMWDIDGTLLTTNRAGIGAWEAAVEFVCGTSADLSGLHTAGLTDREIAVVLHRRYGNKMELSAIDMLLSKYEEALPSALPLREGRVLPGVVGILKDIEGRSAIRSLLLTGNTRRGARAKLQHYGLDRYFSDGAFADDGETRADVARHALTLAKGLFGIRSANEVVVVGDTPADVDCGRCIGARTIAVATGLYSPDELRDSGAWIVLRELPSSDNFFAMLDDDGDSPKISTATS